ncbi:MAG: N-acetylmuramoyl-L-alanine amidase [Proteobacteria bacterium]|nr:N-acetylmuramoyl-L-alanine amidase [Pseudomonadota bacterium]
MRRCLSIVFALLLLAGCVSAPPRNPLAVWVPSGNYNARQASMIVLHYTQEGSAREALDTLRTRNSGGPVSAHYLIGKDGTIYQLVAEDERAWHAGDSQWGVTDDVNSRSIGIELDNNGDEPFAQPEIESLLRLLADITTRLGIPRTSIVGHADIAPTRKDDPGVWFPWDQLAAHGFGLWYDAGALPDPPSGFDPMVALKLVGYDLSDPTAAIVAFHRHYRAGTAPQLDAGDLRILWNLQGKLMRMGTAAPATQTPGPSTH